MGFDIKINDTALDRALAKARALKAELDEGLSGLQHGYTKGSGGSSGGKGGGSGGTPSLGDIRHPTASPLHALLAVDRDFERFDGQLDTMTKNNERRARVESETDKTHEQSSRNLQHRIDAQTKAFEKLRDRADALASSIAEFQSSVRSAVQDFASVMQFKLDPTKGDPGQQLLAMLSGQLGQATDFSNLLQSLAAQGLDPALVQQLAQAGPEALDILRAIQAAGVQNVNAIQAQIDAVASSLGKKLTEPLFGKQADEMDAAVQAMVKSLAKFQKDFKALPADVEKEFRRSVAALVNGLDAVAKGLGGIPGIKIQAAANGFDGIVSAPSFFLAGERGAERVSITPAGAMSTAAPRNGNGPSVTIQIQGDVYAQDAEQFAGRVRDAIYRDKGFGYQLDRALTGGMRRY